MRGKKRIFGFAALLSILLTVPLVFGLGIADVPRLSFGGSSPPAEPLSIASVFVDPAKNITDYEDATHNVTIGSTVTFHINVSGVTDLFVWQVKVEWDKAILNASTSTPCEFLAQSAEPTSSEELGWVMNRTENSVGFSSFAESILGNVSGISGSGRLVSIEFLVVGYGYTNITISVSGSLPTKLLDSDGSSIAFDPVNGWFDNRLRGDTDGDGYVDIGDMGVVSDYWTGPPTGVFPYARFSDLDADGVIDIGDMGIVSDNWNRGPVP